ncbi:MAG: cupin domain-containing protein [archaeon]
MMAIKLIRQLKPDFSDSRGEIFKILDDGKTKIKSVLLITCKKGAIRANHFHKKDSHFTYMLSGSMEYFEEPLSGGKKGSVIIKKGDLLYTPPKVKHAMHFLEESVFLALSPKSRNHEDYEKDTVRVKLI